MVIAEIVPYKVARDRYERQDKALAWHHFELGERSHPEVCREDAITYIADMTRSYIPHPAVPIEHEVDELRSKERPGSKPLKIAWSRPSVPLRIDNIDELEQIVRERAHERITEPLGPEGWSPGQVDPHH
jgi:hypothetical protein